MFRLLRFLAIVVALNSVFPGARPADAQTKKKDDILYLKDGRVIRGTIVEQSPNAESLVIRLYDGTYVRFTRAEIARITQGAPLRQVNRYGRAKDPALAWFLSFLVAGGGQIYNGDIEKAVGAIVLNGIAAVLYFSPDPAECALRSECSQQRTIGLLLGVGTWLTAQIDAPLSARAINNRIGAGTSLTLRPEPHPLGVSLARLQF